MNMIDDLNQYVQDQVNLKKRKMIKERELASKMFNAEEARKRTEDLKLDDDVIFQDTLIAVFEKIEHAINKKKYYVTVGLSENFPIERCSKMTDFFSELGYPNHIEKKDGLFYLNISWGK